MNNKKKMITYSIIGILVMILGVAGITYAWFSTNISGDGAEFNVTTATVGPLTYTGTDITADDVMPGWVSEDATLTIEGTVTGSEAVNYYCSIENTGEVLDVEYRISSDGEDDSTSGTWTSIGTSPIVRGSISSTNESDEYKIAVRFKETGLNQNDQQGKELSVKVTCNLDVTYQVNVTSTDNTLGTVSMTSNEILHGSNAVVNLNPANGYKYSSDTCNGVYKEKTLTINNVTTPTECEVTFEKVCEDGTLCNKILTDNSNVEVRSDFSVIYTASNNGNTIHIANGQDNTPTYYFAGNVTNNYVLFAGSYWRIIRINEDNSVRLLYYGTDKEGTGMFPSTSQAFNTEYNNPSYVGYKYTANAQHGLETNSAMKTYLEGWYTSNLSSYDEYISRTAIYCNDRTIGRGNWNTGSTAFYYSGFTRLYTNKTPTFACSETVDKFTGSEVTGNGELGETPIGLITADEVSYAGGLWNTQNTSYYISEKATGASWWWTMTPYRWNGSYAVEFIVGGSSNTGGLEGYYVNNTRGVRPVISLKGCTTWSNGDGTESSPYEVTVDNACAVSEN